MISFTPDETQLIEQLSVVGGWKDKRADALKRKIKDRYLANGASCCCYCRLSMSAWHRISIDVEHVLPKRRFPEYTFDLRNLNISCKRCNMEIKGVDVRFYLGVENEPDPFRSELYLFIHPNLDRPNDHLQLVAVQVNDKQLIMYIIQTPKGQYTYEYFELKEIEINSFSHAQGVAVETPSDNMPPEIAQELRKVITAIE